MKKGNLNAIDVVDKYRPTAYVYRYLDGKESEVRDNNDYSRVGDLLNEQSAANLEAENDEKLMAAILALRIRGYQIEVPYNHEIQQITEGLIGAEHCREVSITTRAMIREIFGIENPEPAAHMIEVANGPEVVENTIATA